MPEYIDAHLIFWNFADELDGIEYACVEYFPGNGYVSHSYMLIAGGNW